jgi:hypothetical protein
MPRLKDNATPQERRAEVFAKMQDELKDIAAIQADMQANKIENQNDSDNYREPISIELRKLKSFFLGEARRTALN